MDAGELLRVSASLLAAVGATVRIATFIASFIQKKAQPRLILDFDMTILEVRQTPLRTRRALLVPHDYHISEASRKRYWLTQSIVNLVFVAFFGLAASSALSPNSPLDIALLVLVAGGTFYFLRPVYRILRMRPWRATFLGQTASLAFRGSPDTLCQLSYAALAHSNFRLIGIERFDSVESDVDVQPVARLDAANGYYFLGGFIGQSITIEIHYLEESNVSRLIITSENIVPDLVDSPRVDERNLERFVNAIATYPGKHHSVELN